MASNQVYLYIYIVFPRFLTRSVECLKTGLTPVCYFEEITSVLICLNCPSNQFLIGAQKWIFPIKTAIYPGKAISTSLSDNPYKEIALSSPSTNSAVSIGLNNTREYAETSAYPVDNSNLGMIGFARVPHFLKLFTEETKPLWVSDWIGINSGSCRSR